MDFGGIVLSGGKSSRMGTDKGSLEIEGKKMVTYSIDTLSECGIQDVLLITNEPTKYTDITCVKISDEIPDLGPMGGIYTGLKNSRHQFNIVLACDTPMINKDVILLLMKHFKTPVTTISYQGKVQPLISIYSKDVLELMQQSIKSSKFKLIDFITSVDGKILNLDKYLPDSESDCFVNVNSPQDLFQVSLQIRNERL